MDIYPKERRLDPRRRHRSLSMRDVHTVQRTSPESPDADNLAPDQAIRTLLPHRICGYMEVSGNPGLVAPHHLISSPQSSPQLNLQLGGQI